MVDNIRTEADLLATSFQDGQANNSISAQDMRDFIVSTKTFNPELVVGQSNPPHKEGKLFYDDEHKSLSYYNEATEVTLNIGQEMLIRGVATESLTDGDVVFISGASGMEPTFTKAIASAATPTILGVITHTIAELASGYATIFGLVHNIDTSSFTAGDILYLSSSVAGGLTTTAPTLPLETIVIGTVINASNPGHILADPVRINFSNETTAILQASHNVTVVLGTVNVPEPVPLDTNNTIENITHSTSVLNSEITFDIAGVYQTIVGFQISHIGGGSSTITTWVQMDSGGGFVDLPNTAVRQDLSNNDTRVLILNHLGRHAIGHKIRFIWNTTNLSGELISFGANSPTPEVPSVIVTINKLGIE